MFFLQNNDSNSNFDLPTTDPHTAHKNATFTEDNVVVIVDVTPPNVEGDDTSSEDDVSDAQCDGEDDGDVTRRRKMQLIHVERERPTSAFDFHPLRNQKLKLNSNSLTNHLFSRQLLRRTHLLLMPQLTSSMQQQPSQ